MAEHLKVDKNDAHSYSSMAVAKARYLAEDKYPLEQFRDDLRLYWDITNYPDTNLRDNRYASFTDAFERFVYRVPQLTLTILMVRECEKCGSGVLRAFSQQVLHPFSFNIIGADLVQLGRLISKVLAGQTKCCPEGVRRRIVAGRPCRLAVSLEGCPKRGAVPSEIEIKVWHLSLSDTPTAGDKRQARQVVWQYELVAVVEYPGSNHFAVTFGHSGDTNYRYDGMVRQGRCAKISKRMKTGIPRCMAIYQAAAPPEALEA